MQKILIIIAGIGTGGHYFPAVVVAKEFMENNYPTIFLARKGYPEERVAQRYNLKLFYISPRPYYGKSIVNKLWAIERVFESVLRLHSLTKKCAGISFGGFGSLPLIVSCMINNQPFFLFEPNTIPGRTTRMFSRFARKIFLGLPSVMNLCGNSVISGIPVREEFKQAKEKTVHTGTKTVLFMGGSQGARRLNEIALRFQRILPENYKIIIISGQRDFEWVNEAKDFRTEVISFTTEPWEIISQADVVVSRAGALSGYELLLMKKKVIFIPFPYAIDNHQFYNAQYFCRMPNIRMIEEKDLNEEKLLKMVQELMNLPEIEKERGLIVRNDAEKIIVEYVRRELR
ncbi:MAG: glycosyltransferase [candidate division WOR-3 bacterium]